MKPSRDEQVEKLELQLPILSPKQVAARGMVSISTPIDIYSESGIARSMDAGMQTATAAWVLSYSSLELYRLEKELKRNGNVTAAAYKGFAGIAPSLSNHRHDQAGSKKVRKSTRKEVA